MPDLLPPSAEDGPGLSNANINNANLAINPNLQLQPGQIVFPQLRSLRAGCSTTSPVVRGWYRMTAHYGSSRTARAARPVAICISAR
ncbi:hypothetical protein [Pseudomonas anguilliseptica]|nr:hypothetical protein [Pseudomonas anguilliseptica]